MKNKKSKTNKNQMAESLRQAYDYWQDQPECEMAESLRQAYDYWQDQPRRFSTEPKEKASNNKQKQATTSKNKREDAKWRNL